MLQSNYPPHRLSRHDPLAVLPFWHAWLHLACSHACTTFTGLTSFAALLARVPKMVVYRSPALLCMSHLQLVATSSPSCVLLAT